MRAATTGDPVEGYDRAVASRILAGLAFPGCSVPAAGPTARSSRGQARRATATAPLIAEPGSHLTAPQHRYLDVLHAALPGSVVTSATHRVTWNDSDGIPNVAHAGPSSLGAGGPDRGQGGHTRALARPGRDQPSPRPSRASTTMTAGYWRPRPPTPSQARSSGSASRPRRVPSSSTPAWRIRRPTGRQRSSPAACGIRGSSRSSRAPGTGSCRPRPSAAE